MTCCDNYIDIAELLLLKQSNPRELVKINPILRCLLDGVSDDNCILSVLNGKTHVLDNIWQMVTNYWRSCIETSNGFLYESEQFSSDKDDDDDDDDDGDGMYYLRIKDDGFTDSPSQHVGLPVSL